ncbi:unnamed protein product [Phytophthora fragariaefolia]|uniref:Unnamed protein product n=1 Tax=Phytophthora fragariaefolia TaxID=1490495 RepID=A0A9W6YAY0_9STRA|nr:unnamed protein product [Phytophthora fragariaefolia]
MRRIHITNVANASRYVICARRSLIGVPINCLLLCLSDEAASTGMDVSPTLSFPPQSPNYDQELLGRMETRFQAQRGVNRLTLEQIMANEKRRYTDNGDDDDPADDSSGSAATLRNLNVVLPPKQDDNQLDNPGGADAEKGALTAIWVDNITRTQGSATHDESKDAEEAAAEEEDAEASHAVDDDNNDADDAEASHAVDDNNNAAMPRRRTRRILRREM